MVDLLELELTQLRGKPLFPKPKSVNLDLNQKLILNPTLSLCFSSPAKHVRVHGAPRRERRRRGRRPCGAAAAADGGSGVPGGDGGDAAAAVPHAQPGQHGAPLEEGIQGTHGRHHQGN